MRRWLSRHELALLAGVGSGALPLKLNWEIYNHDLVETVVDDLRIGLGDGELVAADPEGVVHFEEFVVLYVEAVGNVSKLEFAVQVDLSDMSQNEF